MGWTHDALKQASFVLVQIGDLTSLGALTVLIRIHYVHGRTQNILCPCRPAGEVAAFSTVSLASGPMYEIRWGKLLIQYPVATALMALVHEALGLELNESGPRCMKVEERSSILSVWIRILDGYYFPSSAAMVFRP
jgi:hypothetical protein